MKNLLILVTLLGAVSASAQEVKKCKPFLLKTSSQSLSQEIIKGCANDNTAHFELRITHKLNGKVAVAHIDSREQGDDRETIENSISLLSNGEEELIRNIRHLVIENLRKANKATTESERVDAITDANDNLELVLASYGEDDEEEDDEDE